MDAQENPLVAFYSMGFHEVQSHLILSEHAYLGYVFSISGKTFEKLSFEDRMLLMQVAKEITPWERQNTQHKEAVLLEKIAASGVKVSRLTEEQKDIFTIGIDADLSMGDPSCGLAIKRGAELALEEINQRGGILGKKVVLIAKDNKAVASTGVENIRGLLKRDDLLAIIGGKHSAVIDDETKIMQAAKKPFLIPRAAATKLTQSDEGESYVFRISANDDLASEFIISHAKK
ncbi:MAG: TRAP transporter substrate-binding protein DctP, partial [Epsilonproteobacteria bacterium]|nr:TRAP transporter substrate-binding protein DctP [Campylobacterota bacterium]